MSLTMDKDATAEQRVAHVFIDGEAGTTGLGIRERLAGLREIAVRSLPWDRRKDPVAKRALLGEVDLVVLCLPDDAARETATLVDELGADAPKVLDASTAHRVAQGWTYGFPELARGQSEAIAKAAKVCNPGCYALGAISLLRPLVDAGLLPADHPITVNAVSGYSGGGRQMIEQHEVGNAPAFELYGLGLEHKHLPEIQRHSGLARRPIFVPSVGRFRQGMLVSVPLHLDTLPGGPKAAEISDALSRHYAGATQVRVALTGKAEAGGRLEPEALNGSDMLELCVFGNEARKQAVLVARLDNLGKGASGQAVQNIQLMLGQS